MRLRETLNNNSLIVAIVAVVVIAGALWIALSSNGGITQYSGKYAYFTDDDGKSYFKDRADTIVPYAKGGKEVLRAHVFKCPSKGTFVAYVQRYRPDTIEAIKDYREATAAGRTPKSANLAMMADQIGSEFKLPGNANAWKKSASDVAGDTQALCDNKPNEWAEFVLP